MRLIKTVLSDKYK